MVAGDQEHERSHNDLEHHGEKDQRGQEDREHFLAEVFRFNLAILALQPLAVEWNEPGREGALAEESAERVRKPEGDEESVCLPARAHHAGHEHLACEAGHAADQG